ncbi:MAG: tRNA (N6-isopentenyl adenosine(37)-C2)-methylthiotransferase MiaB [candidate division WOR-3 bacterium]
MSRISLVSVRNRFWLLAYGCQMNRYEANLVRSILIESGYEEARGEDDANVILMLTCSVREHAEQRALGRLAVLRSQKRTRPDLVVGVLGCMAQRCAETLANGHGADIVAGPDEYRQLPSLVQAFRAGGGRQVAVALGGECYDGILPQVSSAGNSRVSGFISVMRGCDSFCTYCVVPYVRGHERSKPCQAVLAEFEHLRDSGVKDVTLLGQNVLAYSHGGLDFAGLLRLIDEQAGDTRVRFLTSHPRDVTPQLVEVLAGLRSWCAHLHLPLQSGSDSVLRRMNRHYGRLEYLDRIEMLRAAIPGLALTTDVMVGFPGETEADFEQTLAVVERVGYDFAYMFRYSERPGTMASALADKVPARISSARLSRLIAVQSRITREKSLALCGQELEVLVEDRRGSSMLARTRGNKIVVLREPVPLGTTVTVRIEEVQGWTPIGVPVGRKP